MKTFFVGVDEVGRGSIAGPVVAAAIILKKKGILSLKDSKLLSPKKRQILSEDIKKNCVDYSIAEVSSKNIDKIFNNWKRKEDNFGLSQIFVLAHEEFINAENLAIAEDRINKSTEIIINRQEERLEEGLSYLSTVASVSPFIGLFGTVWGVMNAFSGLAQLSQVSINAVAPGISEALVATALGLFAAIPALISYNWSVRSIDTIIKSYDNFTSELLITYQEYNVQEKRKK